MASFERGEIWWVRLPESVGREMRSGEGRRPVMIVTNADFHTDTGLVWAVSLTRGMARTAGLGVNLMGLNMKTDGWARCEMLHCLDLEARKAEYSETAPDFVVDQVLGMLEFVLDKEMDKEARLENP